jgi:hypothetical protein
MEVANKSTQLLLGIERLIEQTGRDIAVYLITQISRLYWTIGNYIIVELQYENYSQHGQQILATLSQQLTEKFGKGYTYSAFTRMIKVAEAALSIYYKNNFYKIEPYYHNPADGVVYLEKIL